MSYRLPSERVPVTVGELTIEVASIVAWPIYAAGARLGAAFDPERSGAAQLAALTAMYENFIAEAQPTWEIVDHRGPVPPNLDGMYRLPLAVAFGMVNGWLETMIPKASAVDMIIPPGQLRDDLNAALKRKAG